MANVKANKPPQVFGTRFSKKDLGEDYPDQIEDDGEDESVGAGTMVPIICMYEGASVRFTIAGRHYRMRYGDVKDLELGYASLRQTQPGADPLPSVIELYTNRKVLPVADPRVPKDKDGTPLAVVAAQERAARNAPPRAPQTQATQPTAK